MITIQKIATLLAVAFLATGCMHDALEPLNGHEDEPTNMVRFSVESPSTTQLGSTVRSASNTEMTIHHGYIFFFNDDRKLVGLHHLDKEVDEITNNGYKNPSFEITDPSYRNGYKLICVFNYDETNFSSDFSDLTPENVSAKFPMTEAFLARVEASQNGTGEGGTRYDVGMPMFVNDFTDVNTSTHEVYRAMARMSISMPDSLVIPHESHSHLVLPTDFSFALVNRANAGRIGFTQLGVSSYVTGGSSDIYTEGNVLDFSHHIGGCLNEGEHHDHPKIYLFEYPYATLAVDGMELDANQFDAKRFAIILAHDDAFSGNRLYYKLNLVDKLENRYFNAERNHDYRIEIKAINSRGYDTLEEAYAMPPSNIEYEIYDDQGELTYSNGQYAISMDEVLSYDEVLVYGHKDTKLEFNNIRYLLPHGGEMDDDEFITNEVYFKVVNNSDSLITETTSDFAFNSEFKSKLTDQGQNITVTLSGEGECTIALRIRLGNLDIGRDEITIRKVAPNGGGDGALDAHPNHIELKGQAYVEGSWQSDDLDFGARASSREYDDADGGTVIYMGENVTPTGYKTMDGYVSGEHSVNSYPVFSPKTRKGFYSYTKSDGHEAKVMIQVEQLAPFYLGHFGDTSPAGDVYHYLGLVCEKIEEVPLEDGNGNVVAATNGVEKWSEVRKVYYTGTIWGQFLTFGERYHNMVDGHKISKNIVENNTSEAERPNAAYYCYMKNDVNGNQKIDSNEPIQWYLPAQNQMLAMWINMNVFESDLGLYALNNTVGRDSRPYYWTCSEVDAVYDYTWTKPTDYSSHAIIFNLLEGQGDYIEKDVTFWSQCHIRCVRGLH